MSDLSNAPHAGDERDLAVEISANRTLPSDPITYTVR
jgi:hypothetical protein